MKKLTATLLAAGIIAGASPVVMAEDGTSFNLAATNNYMFRGLTQTNNQAAIQGGVDNTSGKLSLGVWASNVDFVAANTQGFEIDLYGSYAVSDKASVGAIYYYYTASGNASFYEINGGYDFGIASASVSYAPSIATGTANLYLEVGGSTEVSKGVNLDWHVGNANGNGATSFTDYSIGVSSVFSGLDVSASYVGGSPSGSTTNQFVISAGKTF